MSPPIRGGGRRRTRGAGVSDSLREAGYDIEREVMDLTTGEQVKQAMDELPTDERRAIELAYFGGLTYRQVAAALDQPEGTVKSRIRAGLRRMRGTLTDAGVGGA